MQPGFALNSENKVGLPLLAGLLAEQQELTAVERFAQKHADAELPAQARYYEELIPLTTPGPGEQYGFGVDLDMCTGCKACVSACHSLNGLDEGESWRQAGEMHGGAGIHSYQQTVTAACHHCVEPACSHGCPVKAYHKDPVTGIVHHLDDQCIGCQYCSLKCPYDVPRYNSRMGIVRKCDMCSSRLATGEAPACVQSCPNGAISIRIVEQKEMQRRGEAGEFLPTAPLPSYTLPTTTYETRREIPENTVGADFYELRPQPPHLPLVFMLTLTQLSVGAFCADYLTSIFTGTRLTGFSSQVHALFALAVGLLALGASTLHLGRPLYAFRAIIGLRTSWLSREIAAFGLFSLLAMVWALCVWLPALATFAGISLPAAGVLSPELLETLMGLVCLAGLTGLFCSVMLYVDTRRRWWAFYRTLPSFGLTAAILGIHLLLTSHLAVSLVQGQTFALSVMDRFGTDLSLILTILGLARLLMDVLPFAFLRSAGMPPMKRAARLMQQDMKYPFQLRLALGWIGTVLIPFGLYQMGASAEGRIDYVFLADLALIGFFLSLLGEGLEKYLFFTLVDAPRMPGAGRRT